MGTYLNINNKRININILGKNFAVFAPKQHFLFVYDEGEIRMNNFLFSFKSNWYENEVIKNIGSDLFFLYLNIRKYELKQNRYAACISIELMFEEISKYHVSNGRKYTRPDIKSKLLELRKKKVVNFEGRVKSNEQLIKVEFLDLPNLDVKFKPMSDDDNFVIVETQFIDQIMICGLKEEHVTLYLYLKKFNKISNPSYASIGRMLGINKDTANRYGKQLEKNKLLVNKRDKAQTGRNQNHFLVPDAKGYDKFVDDNEEHFTKLEVEKIKKKLKNHGIKVTKRAYDDISHLFQYLTSEEKELLSDKHKKHVVYAIEHLYFELKDKLESRYKNK